MTGDNAKFFVRILFSAVLMIGCDSGDNDNNPGNGSDPQDSDTTPQNPSSDSDEFCPFGARPEVCANLNPAGVLTLNDSVNYSYTSSINITHSVLKGGTPDLVFDWSMLSEDLFGREVVPTQHIDTVVVSLWNMTQEELKHEINNDSLDQTSVIVGAYVQPMGSYTQAGLTQFGPSGMPVEWEGPNGMGQYFNTDGGYDPTKFTHLVMAQSGTRLGQNARMVGFFTLDPNSTNTKFDITNDLAALEYEVDITSQGWLPVAPAMPNLTIIWETLTRNGQGHTPFAFPKVDTVVVAQFADMNVCQLKKNFVSLREMATGWWEKTLPEVTDNTTLNDLVDANQMPFTGITTTGTWILGLFCIEKCSNPAPWFFTILQPCG